MSMMDIFKIATSMFGGLSLFLTGMNSLSESLTSLTGGALNRVIGKVTKNRLSAMIKRQESGGRPLSASMKSPGSVYMSFSWTSMRR